MDSSLQHYTPVLSSIERGMLRFLTATSLGCASAEGTYHRLFDVCIPKWLNQAGVKDDFVRLEDVGIQGNMHEMFLDRNSDEVIKFIDAWVGKNVK